MSSEKSVTPQIRFKGFTEAWEQRKVADIASSTRGGGTPSTSNKAYWNGEIPWIQSSDLADGKLFGVKPRKHISMAGLSSSATQLVPKNSIAVVTRVGVGKLAFMPYSYTTSQDFLSLCRVQTEPYFTAYSLYQMLQSELQTVQGTSIKGMTKENLLSKSIFVPRNIDEQHQLGLFFSSLDNLITLHQRKLDILKKIKSALLEKMFPKDGSDIPEIRFTGFTEAWEQRELGDIAEIIGGGTPDTNNPSYWDGDIDWYSPAELGEQIYAIGSRRRITKEGYKNSSAKLLPANKTILFTSRAGIGTTAILCRSACTNQGFQSLVINDNTDLYFIYSMSSRIKDFAISKASGSTFLEISGKQLATMNLFLPQLNEQRKIGQYFKSLDNLITLHQRKLNALKKIKSALLEKMFV